MRLREILRVQVLQLTVVCPFPFLLQVRVVECAGKAHPIQNSSLPIEDTFQSFDVIVNVCDLELAMTATPTQNGTNGKEVRNPVFPERN